MERLSLASFLANGHPYHLFVYNDVKHIPAGVIVEEGPPQEIFSAPRHERTRQFLQSVLAA